MSRPVKVRRICSMPQVREFIPRPNACEGHIQMSIDEYEVIRLIDNLGYSQKECSEQMCVARTTVQAIYDAARRKIADAIVNGRRLVIAGGNYAVCPAADFSVFIMPAAVLAAAFSGVRAEGI